MTKHAPVNTTKQAFEDPMGVLAEAMVVGASGMVENEEKSGQASLVESDTLPTDISPANGKAILETAGVKFLGVVDGDALFQHVELPQGWKKVATDNPMRSKLVDDKGLVRAAIFYKAAFYDRRADMDLTQQA